MKTLYKDTHNKIICGVCSGIAQYLNIDANVIRILAVILCCGAGIGLIAYIIAAIILPEKPY